MGCDSLRQLKVLLVLGSGEALRKEKKEHPEDPGEDLPRDGEDISENHLSSQWRAVTSNTHEKNKKQSVGMVSSKKQTKHSNMRWTNKNLLTKGN